MLIRIRTSFIFNVIKILIIVCDMNDYQNKSHYFWPKFS